MPKKPIAKHLNKQAIRVMFKQGFSYGRIAKELKCSRTTIYNLSRKFKLDEIKGE